MLTHIVFIMAIGMGTWGQFPQYPPQNPPQYPPPWPPPFPLPFTFPPGFTFPPYPPVKQSRWKKRVEKWEDPPVYYMDLDAVPYFISVIAISMDGPNPSGDYHDHQIITTGIFFNEDHILTSFNPYRRMVKMFKLKKNMIVTVAVKVHYGFEERWYDTYVSYDYISTKISCGRQVMPIRDRNIPKDKWFGGNESRHSPLHDLMVIKTKKKMKFEDRHAYDFRYMWADLKAKNETDKFDVTCGPTVCLLAQPGMTLGKHVEFASVGARDEEENFNSHFLFFHQGIVTSCDEWIPRDWGHLICVKHFGLEMIASGSVLHYNDHIFGVASFFFERVQQSILVFTDVRPYYHLIVDACSDADGFEENTS